MEPLPSGIKRPLPQDIQKKLKSVLQEISTSSDKIYSKLTHVEPVVHSQMPTKLEDALCLKYKPFPITSNYICPRFDVNDPAAYKHLATYGYVVFKDIIPNKTEVNEIKNMIWDWLEQLSFPNKHAINRNDPESWHDGNWPTDPDTGIIFSFGIGQTEFMWRCRSYSGVKRAFSNIWNTDDLITSFDGMNIYRPWKYYLGWKTKGKWWHLDQNARRKESRGKQSIQGLLALTDGNEKTGGLCVIPTTHLQHTEICERIHWPSHSDYIPIPRKDKMFDDFRKIGGYLVHYKAGDLVLWDGRTVHCNAPSVEPDLDPKTGKEWFTDKEKKAKQWDLTRMVLYICMGPRQQAKNEVLKKRQEIAFALHTTSTHFPQFFRYRLGASMIKHNGFKLNEAQKELVGYPRNMWQEFIWQMKHEYEIGFSDLWMFSSCVAALSVAANVYWRNKKKHEK